MTTALITGAAGFMARALVPELRRHGMRHIAGADVRDAPDGRCDRWYRADLTDAQETSRIVAAVRPTVIFHLAGLIRGSADEIRISNVTTTTRILDAVVAHVPDARVVVIGSAAEYGMVPPAMQPVREAFAGQPLNPYGQAKHEVRALATQYAERGLHVAVARPFNALGPGISEVLVVGAIVHRLRAALAGPPPRAIRIGTTTSVRDFVAIEDVARGLVCVSTDGAPGAVYNFCSGVGHSIDEVLRRLLVLAGEPITIRRDDALVRSGEVDALVGSYEKAQRDLGWRPMMTLDESLRETWEAAGPPGSMA